MTDNFEQRLKAIEEKINEIAFVLSSNELYMKVPVSPLTSMQQSSEEPEEEEEKEESTPKQEPSVEDEDDEEEEEPSENPDEIHDPEDEDD